MAAVTHTLALPGGGTPSRVDVTVELVASTGRPLQAGHVISTDLAVAGTLRVATTTGTWTADLALNADISPANTYYRVTEIVAGGPTYVHSIRVTAAGNLPDMLVDPPASLATAGSEDYTDAQLAAHRAAADPHPAYTTAAEVQATAVGGDLTGTVANAQIAAGTVGLTELAAAAKPAVNVKDPAYGAVGDGVANDTAAIQAAINAAAAAGGKGVVYFPAGLYSVGTLNLPSQGVTFQGVQDGSASGSYGSFLRASTGTLFQPGSANMSGVHFRDLVFQAVAGHIFDLGAAAVSGCEWVNCIFNAAAGYNAFRVVNGVYIDNVVRGGSFSHNLDATVPTIYLSSNGGAINSNTWTRFRFTYTGLYFAHIESTVSSSYCYDNVFRDITAEIPRGGVMRFWGCRNTLVEQVNTYDLGATATTQHLIAFGAHPTAPGALTSVDNTVRLCEVRNPATLGSGLAHIRSAGSLAVEGCNSRIDLASTGNNLVLAAHGGSPAATIVGDVATDLIFTPGTEKTKLSDFTLRGSSIQFTFAPIGGLRSYYMMVGTPGNYDGHLRVWGGAGSAASPLWWTTAGTDYHVNDLRHDNAAGYLNFFGVAPVQRQTATTDIKDALTNYGLLQGTSASPLNLDGGVLTAGSVSLGGPTVSAGTGTPEGVVTASVGSLFLRADGGAGASLYVKETGGGNTGWVAK